MLKDDKAQHAEDMLVKADAAAKRQDQRDQSNRTPKVHDLPLGNFHFIFQKRGEKG